MKDMSQKDTTDGEIERINKRKLEQIVRRQQRREQEAQSAQKQDGKMIILTDATFSSEVSKKPLTVVDFWAPWCGPCRMMSPIIEELARDYAGKVAFGKLNVDENPLTSSNFQVQSIPTILIFRKGQMVDGVLGAMPRAFLESKIRPYLSEEDKSGELYR